jgi:hypothetical protein
MRTVEFSIPDFAEELARAATRLPPRPKPETLSDGELRIAVQLHPAACGCIYHVEIGRRTTQ